MSKVITTELQHSGASSANITLASDGSVTLPSDTIDEAKLKVSNTPTNGYFLSAQSGNTGGLTWAEAAGAGGDNDVTFTTTGKGLKFTGNSSTGYILGNTASGTDGHAIAFNVGGNLNNYLWKYGGTAEMRFDSTGSVRVCSEAIDTATNYDTTTGIWLMNRSDGSRDIANGTICCSRSGDAALHVNLHTSGSNLVRFRYEGSTKGTISTDGSNTAYNTSSDYRLKENVTTLSGAITRLNQLKPSRFNWKSDSSKTVMDGFIAHEVATVVPEAVQGTKDQVDSEDRIEPQQFDASKLVPLLTAALQEAITEIETLKTKVAALEAA
tara:strand:- start:45 stop:1019 length:975 start_codon:yes stop_codon:yes gene_type:complete